MSSSAGGQLSRSRLCRHPFGRTGTTLRSSAPQQFRELSGPFDTKTAQPFSADLPAISRERRTQFELVLSASYSIHPDTLGVACDVNIDTTCGPRFGSQHGDPGFLATGEVVLTFDDGPAPASTRAILAALASECTKATFFVVGEMAAAHPEVGREIALQGHTIGTHTRSHANLRRLSEASMKAQIEAAFTEAEKAAGEPIAPFFRFPYLSSTHATDAYLKSRDIAQFSIDIDSLDWRTRDAQSVVRRVMAQLEARGNGIILMHDIHASTALAVPTLLAHLREKGFKVVHLRPTVSLRTLVVSQWRDRTTGVYQRRRPFQAKTQQDDGWPTKWPPW